MRTRLIFLTAIVVGLISLSLNAESAGATEVRVMISGGFSAAYRNLVPEFERTTGIKIVTTFAPSAGRSPQTIPNRINRGEPVDVVMMLGDALNELIRQGKVVSDSRVDLAQTGVGLAVRAGAPKPDIGSVIDFKRHSSKQNQSRILKSEVASISQRYCFHASESLTKSGLPPHPYPKPTVEQNLAASLLETAAHIAQPAPTLLKLA
jgi:ABC-type molybdate transport system substrate-binding protein